MILVEAGIQDKRSFEAKVQFARQLSDCGHRAVVDADAVTQDLDRSVKYEAIRFAAQLGDINISRVLIIGAEEISDSLIDRLRKLQLGPEIPVTAIGRFDSRQAQIGAQSKIAYALGFEPALLDLAMLQPRPILGASIAPLFATRSPGALPRKDDCRVSLVVPYEFLEEETTLPFLGMLNHVSGLKCRVITSGSGKELIRISRYSGINAVSYSELGADTLASLSDVAVFFGAGIPGERMAAFGVDLMQNRGVLIDCTQNGAIAGTGAPAVRGPIDMAGLVQFLQASVLPNLQAIGKETADHPWLAESAFGRLEKALSLPAVQLRAVKKPQRRKSRVIFVPTNGVGLGHAQRCSLIAGQIGQGTGVGFAAFPSCVPMLQARGFDCLALVQKSDQHLDPFANDLLNYLRIGQVVQPGDRLVFDGGYVFDSIFRTILERRLGATWIRRGLWQPGQINKTALERESVFDQVIIPREAFDELNSEYTFGDHIHQVGPVVQQKMTSAKSRAGLREKLKSLFKRDFETLVVTMLGGGEAADRSAQMQSLCAQFSARPDCLHLIVVWPTAKISAGLYGWSNSHIVKSQHALELCHAADFVVSAAGYNSYHEVLYHQIPTIFIPQMTGFMDDQERRARAASERGLAVTVLSHELLMLQREVAAFLDNKKGDDIRRQLDAVSLPDPGTEKAARLIEQGGGT